MSKPPKDVVMNDPTSRTGDKPPAEKKLWLPESNPHTNIPGWAQGIHDVARRVLEKPEKRLPTPVRFTFSKHDIAQSERTPQRVNYGSYPQRLTQQQQLLAAQMEAAEEKGSKPVAKTLDEVRDEGIRGYHLSREQVANKNFGEHTLKAIDHVLKQHGGKMLIQDAYTQVKDLNKSQVEIILSRNIPVPGQRIGPSHGLREL